MKLRILLVCKFNRFRSRFAEAYFNKVNANRNVVVKSAGLIKGKPLDRELLQLAKQSGLKIQGPPKSLSMDLLNWQNLIIIVADNVPPVIFEDHRIRTNQIIVWGIKEGNSSVKTIKKNVDDLIKDFNLS